MYTGTMAREATVSAPRGPRPVSGATPENTMRLAFLYVVLFKAIM